MKRMLLAAVAVISLGGTALADTIKVGVVGPFSGPFAIQGKNFKAGIDAWTALNGAKVGNDDVADCLFWTADGAEPGDIRPVILRFELRPLNLVRDHFPLDIRNDDRLRGRRGRGGRTRGSRAYAPRGCAPPGPPRARCPG